MPLAFHCLIGIHPEYMVGPAFATTIVTLLALLMTSEWRCVCLIVASIALQIMSYMLAVVRLPNTANGKPMIREQQLDSHHFPTSH